MITYVEEILQILKDKITINELLIALLGAIFAQFLIWCAKHRSLKLKVIKKVHESTQETFGRSLVISIFNPNNEVACLYNFNALSRKGKEFFPESGPTTQRVQFFCANQNTKIEEVTFINPFNVYPLKIFFEGKDSFWDEAEDPIAKVFFYSKTCGFFMSKLQFFFPNIEKKYSINVRDKYDELSSLKNRFKRWNLWRYLRKCS